MKSRVLKYSVLALSISLSGCSWDLFNSQSNPPAARQTAYRSNAQVIKQTETINTAVAQPNNSTPPVNNIDSPPPPVMASQGEMGGNLSRAMDSIDKSKLSHALDKPVGKSSQWTNDSTGTKYTVIPVEKVTIEGNSYCRRYRTTAQRNGNANESVGVACVGADGNWQQVG
ncbi:MAG: hypothetical protein H0W64_01570 [Gammaproteobacteria bacterium]|nr:hypothetical protein [Gammaproteobacteria bacterium]